MKPHDSSYLHVQGLSEFIDDKLIAKNEVFVDIIYSTEAYAEIRKTNFLEIKKKYQDLNIFTAKDFKHNLWGTIFEDQHLLADKIVNYNGEPIALFVSSDRNILRKSKKEVKIDYIKLSPILSLKKAIEKKSFIGSERKIVTGDFDNAFKKSNHQINGEIKIGGADHFYLENQACISYPKDDGQIEVHSSSQHPTEVQHVVSHALGLKSKDVICIVKRMGGAFGGKESQAAPFGAYTALVAHKLKVPARLLITKDDDMIITGKRNPFYNLYRVGFDRVGKINALEIKLYSDAGAYADLSTAIMERAMLHCDNSYFIPNVIITGQVCKTNFQSHTAFRGFGGPKGVATIEKIIEEISHFLKIDALEVRKINCYNEKQNKTPYGQIVQNNMLPSLFENLESTSHYTERRRKINEHNKSSLKKLNLKLKGLSLTSVKFGISFTTRFLNQGNALVNIFRDGSIQVSTGATEMGQGVYSRISDLICNEFGLTRNDVKVLQTSTEKNANTSPTAASSGTDINGAAALMAAQKIKSRLSFLALQLFKKPQDEWAKNTAGLGTQKEIEFPNEFEFSELSENLLYENGFIIQKDNPQNRVSFSDLTNEAYLNRISLCEYAHFKFPNLNYNKVKGQGNAFLYFTQGTACSEVSIDLLTGEVKVLRVDILMDLGRPINEGLDIGQVTGAFVQGMGWVTTENLFYSDKGLLLSHSPSTYKIPNVQDTPRIFNVDLITNNDNTVNVKGTKAVGEPPLLLSLSVWTAIQDALKYLPEYENKFPHLAIPATGEAIIRKIYPKAFTK